MPLVPGLLAMPTVLANALLSFAPDRSIAVRGRDSVGVVSPMFNEEAGAAAALGSLLTQSEPFDELAVSVNGGADRTLEVVRHTLAEHGFTRVYGAPAADFVGTFERWYRGGGPAVAVVNHAAPISKSDSINAVLDGGYLTCDRLLVVDGDTILDHRFLARLKDNFYRLTVERRGGRRHQIIEDSAIQSGAVTSLRPGPGQAMAGLISRARAGEYAVAAVLRAGQAARLGRGRVFGASRLYTAVGCGFVARRGSFPMPADTLTEDHDFTLQVQNEPTTERRVGTAELTRRGFRVKVGERFVEAADFFDPQDEITLRRSGNARFVTEALMYTEDPTHLPGYMRQIERWNGGGVENALKRLFRPAARAGLAPNVAFTVLAAQFENLFGLLLLLLALPVALGLNFALPGYGTALSGLAAWLGFDLLVTLLLVGLGFGRLWHGQGVRGWRLALGTAGSTIRSALPLLSLRLLNAVGFVAAASRAVPAFLRASELDPRTTITWERPRAVAKRRLGVRTTTVGLGMLLTNVVLFAGAVYLAEVARPGYKETWQLLNAEPRVRTEEHVELPLPLWPVLLPAEDVAFPEREAAPGAGEPLPAEASPARDAPPRPSSPEPASVPPEERGGGDENRDSGARRAVAALPPPAPGGISAFCSVGATARPAAERRLLGGDAAAYEPLTYWERLMLARLTPLAAHLEEAATAYDLPPRLLLLILINESYLDPLAVGPTSDLGLSQVTGEALTLLRELSTDPLSPFANDQLFGVGFNVFDPDFSICAGAAKLAWARAQPRGEDDRFAYARYINPLEGVQRGVLNPVHAELVAALDGLEPLVDALGNAFAAYRSDPIRVTAEERALLDLYSLVAAGELSVRSAYLATGTLVGLFGIGDAELYREVRERLYGVGLDTVSLRVD